MKYYFLLVMAAFSFMISCNSKEYKDYSLQLEQYREMGIADPSEVWDFDDIRTAHNSLSGIKWDKPYQLPRQDSEKSGVLFDRMVGLENMTFLQDDTLKLHEKAYYALEFLRMMERWRELYTNPIWKTQYYQRELVEININEVRVTQIMVEIADQIMESDDPVDRILQEGVPTVKESYVSSLKKALMAQNMTSAVLKEDIDRMADSLGVSVLRNRGLLDMSSMKDIKESLRAYADSTSSDYVRTHYTELANNL